MTFAKNYSHIPELQAKCQKQKLEVQCMKIEVQCMKIPSPSGILALSEIKFASVASNENPINFFDVEAMMPK